MAASVFDSALMGRLFDGGDVGRLFSDTAEIRAMLLVEGALAKSQAKLGTIPDISAAAIARAAMEIQVDPGALAVETGKNGVSVPALVAAFRNEMSAPEHAQYVHWGATSQDIMDTGLMLRLRQALAIIGASTLETLKQMAELAERHAETPMPARSYGQHATPTSFGAVVASWGFPLTGLQRELVQLRRDCLVVSLSGAAGNASELGQNPAKLRRELADALGLSDPERSWHVDRTPLLKLADWFTRLTVAFGKLGEDVTELAQTGIGEIRFGGAGSSSTMPQKQNPVAASLLVALGRQCVALNGALQGAAMPRYQRDGASWFTEWMCLPQIVLCAASAAIKAGELINQITPQTDVMRATLAANLGMVHAEALSFALAAEMPRYAAQQAVKKLCAEALETTTPLSTLARRDFPDLDTDRVFDVDQQLGAAPAEARDFARKVHELSAELS